MNTKVTGELTRVDAWATCAVRHSTAFASGELSAGEYLAVSRQLNDEMSEYLKRLPPPQSPFSLTSTKPASEPPKHG